MARNDTAWFRVTVIILAIAIFLALPLAVLIWTKAEKRATRQDAIIDQQNRKIANLEKKMAKGDDE
jgi:hypothetical protein